MMIFRICHFATELDDVVVAQTNGSCICLQCFTGEKVTHVPMRRNLRRDVGTALSELNFAM